MSNVTEGRFIQHLDFLQKQCVENDLDSVGLITGREGAGKSGLAFIASLYLTRKLGEEYDPETQVHWSGSPYMASSQHLKAGMPITMDELVRDGTSYNFMSDGNRTFASYLTVCRERNLCHFLVNPSKRWTSPIIKEHRAYYEYQVVRRFRNHAVAKCMQLRDDDDVFQSPRHLFTFTYPKPQGALWDRVQVRKKEFSNALAEDRADEHEAAKAVRVRMKSRLQGLVDELLSQ